MAQARESGIEPAHEQFGQLVTREATESGRRNTEFHYAFEPVKVLARLNKKTFNLVAPPIKGRAPESVAAYLKEGTRLWLYGFHGASVALSRACLEEILKIQLGPRLKGPAGLESLMEMASKFGILDDPLVVLAHIVRQTGNRFLHGKAIDEKDSRVTLDAVRGIVEQVFSSRT